MKVIYGLLMCFTILLSDFFLDQDGFCEGQPWGAVKDKHFVINFESSNDRDIAKDLLKSAEEYYQKIGDDIGYSRINKMWTWDDRVQIFLFATQSSYAAKTGSPGWSTGYADRDSKLLNTKTIMTYKQEGNFVDGLLPHEISHLILHDFLPKSRIPIWFDEGVAQLQEKDKRSVARVIMQNAVIRKQEIPFAVLFHWDIRQEQSPMKVELFYAESLTVVDFLILKFGKEKFGRLCRDIRDGKTFAEALLSAYCGNVRDMADFENKWKSSLTY